MTKGCSVPIDVSIDVSIDDKGHILVHILNGIKKKKISDLWGCKESLVATLVIPHVVTHKTFLNLISVLRLPQFFSGFFSS